MKPFPSSSPARVRVLLVGEGPPKTGGIPTFLANVLSDRSLTQKVHLTFLNTSQTSPKHPAALNLSNVKQLFGDVHAIFTRAGSHDVVHLNLAPAPLLPLIRSLVLTATAKARGARVILHAHTGRLHRFAHRPVYRFFLRILLAVTDVLIVVSSQAQDALQGIGGTVLLLENGIDSRQVGTGPKKENPLTLSFVGTVCERKGLLDLRDALLLLSTHHGVAPGALRVLIIGDARQEGPGVFERMQRLYAESGLTNVEFVGRVDRAQTLELLAPTSIFCLPSHWEGFPMSVLEGMAAGASVVASNVGEIPAMLDHGKTGILVEPHDPEGLAAALSRLTKDGDYRRALGRAARSRVERSYAQSRTTSKLRDLYETLNHHSTYPSPRKDSSIWASSSGE